MQEGKEQEMKGTRQSKILDIIKRSDISTQNQLLEALAEEGISSTQATLSRDIKELRLVKELAANGTYRYASDKRGDTPNYNERMRTIFRESVKSVACAQNIIVIKTLPGLASAVCSAIDGMHVKVLAGTLAGDDTAFLAMKDMSCALQFCKEIEAML